MSSIPIEILWTTIKRNENIQRSSVLGLLGRLPSCEKSQSKAPQALMLHPFAPIESVSLAARRFEVCHSC